MNSETLRPLVITTTMVLAVSIAHVAQARTFRCGNQDVQCLILSIDEANANGHGKNTIRLEGDTYTLRDVNNDTDGPNGLPSITSTLTIVATDAALISRDSSASAFRLFHVAASGHLTLERVVLSNGRAGNGGGGLLNKVGR